MFVSYCPPQGHFGMVYKGKLKNHIPGYPEQDVAVKIIKPDRKDSQPEQFQQEIKAMSRCDHKNIVKVLGYCEGKRRGLSEDRDATFQELF